MSEAKLSLGIDGGASSAKWCLLDQDAKLIKQGALPPIDGHLYRTESLQRFRDFLAAIKKEINPLQPNSIVIGLTGFGAPELIESEIRSEFPKAEIQMSTDIALAYHSEFSLGEGIFLYAGTGSVAIHLTADNQIKSVGGWGYLLGDEGAGFWIGRESLRHLLLQSETGEAADQLSSKVSEHIGGSSWSTVRSFVYGQDRSAVAALAPLVAQLASEENPDALKILDQAANHLSDLVARLKRVLQNSDLPIAFGGGISETLVRDLLQEKLGKPLKISQKNHAETAAKLGL